MRWPSYSDFDKVGEFYVSLAAIILGNLCFICYRFFEVNTLFDVYLQIAKMDAAAVWIASKLISIVVIFTMLLISVNSNRFRYPVAAEVLGFFVTLFINLYFWDVWNTAKVEELWFKVGISIVTAVFDVAFAHLFVMKWRERQHVADAQRLLSELKQHCSESEQRLSGMEQELAQAQRLVDERIHRLQETTCPKCGRDDFKTRNAVNAHVHRCKGAEL